MKSKLVDASFLELGTELDKGCIYSVINSQRGCVQIWPTSLQCWKKLHAMRVEISFQIAVFWIFLPEHTELCQKFQKNLRVIYSVHSL